MSVGFNSFDMGFSVMGTLVIVFFIVTLGIIVFSFATGIKTWNKNNHSPRLTVDASVVSKRMNVTHHHSGMAGDPSGAHGFSSSSSTRYYVTFQVESGDRMELLVSGQEYGMLVEGDMGHLSFQGTRYLGFERF